MKKVKWWPPIIILNWIFPFLFASCVNPSTVMMPKVIDSLVYNTNLFYRGNHWGVVNDTMIYFANLPTQKQIKVFHLDGQLLRTIPLYRVLDENKIDNFYFRSLDRIVVLSHYTNTLYEIDGEGTIIKSLALDPGGNDVWEFSGHNTALLPDGSLIFSCEWRDLRDRSQALSTFEFKRFFYYNVWKKPLLVKVSDDLVQGSSQDFVWSPLIYQHLFPKDSLQLYVEPITYSFQRDSIYHFSRYSNRILVLNQSLRLKSEHAINSDYISIGRRLISLDESIEAAYKVFHNSWCISKLLWDKYRQCYYVVISIPSPADTGGKGQMSKWILQVYDHNFSRLHEYVMENRDYSSFCLFVTEKGLAIRKNDLSEQVDLKNKKEVFHVFDL